jgi:uncharacterized protein (TIGR02147 family)
VLQIYFGALCTKTYFKTVALRTITPSMNPTTQKPHEFRVRLQEELINRCRKNPSYSLRAFARSLNIQSSALAEMLNGKRNITPKSIEKLGLVLGLSMDELNVYLVKEKKKKSKVAETESTYRQVTIDQYALISDWYHYAIIELLKVEDFRPDNAWMARVLGITKSEVNFAVERLLRLGLIEQTEAGDLVDTSTGFSTNISGNLTSTGSKQLQKQILEQSIEKLMTLPIEVRNHTSMTMAIDPKHLPEAIKRITKFRRELCDYLESLGDPTEVYQLSLSLFPITQIAKENINGENV